MNYWDAGFTRTISLPELKIMSRFVLRDETYRGLSVVLKK